MGPAQILVEQKWTIKGQLIDNYSTFLDKRRPVWGMWFYSFFHYWKKWKYSRECQLPFWDQKTYFANNTFSSKLRFNLSLEQPSASCLGIVSLFLVTLSKCGFKWFMSSGYVFPTVSVSTYSLTCLRQGTEFLMQVPVRMSTLSTMTKGFSSRVTMERWFSSASSSP